MNDKRFARALFLVLMMLVAMTAAAKIVVSTTNNLRLRTGPSTNYPMLVWISTGKPVHINKGESLTYLGDNDTPDFYNVSFDGKSVYVSKQYSLLVDPDIPVAPVTPPSVIHEPVVVVNGVSVRLRWGPSLDASVFTDGQGKPIYPSKGSQLTYLGESGNWYKVSYKGNVLYISKSYSYLR